MYALKETLDSLKEAFPSTCTLLIGLSYYITLRVFMRRIFPPVYDAAIQYVNALMMFLTGHNHGFVLS